MDISNFISGVTTNISNKLTPKSISASTVGATLIDLANITKTAVEAKIDSQDFQTAVIGNQHFNKNNKITAASAGSGYFLNRYISTTDGSIRNDSVSIDWEYASIPIASGTTHFTVSGLLTTSGKTFRFSDINDMLIPGQFGALTAVTSTVSVPQSAKYFQFNYRKAGVSADPNTAKNSIMVNTGTVALSYQEFNTPEITGISGLQLKASSMSSNNVVPYPVNNSNAANKFYVDNSTATKADKTEVNYKISRKVNSSDKSSNVPPKGGFTINNNGDFILSAITGVWNIQMLNTVTNELTFTGNSSRFWLVIGYKDSTNLCSVGIGNVFGRIVNIDLSGETFSVIKAEPDTPALGANEQGKIIITGNAITLYKSNTLIVSQSIAEVLSLGGNIQNLQLGIAAFNPNGTAITTGTTITKNVLLDSYQPIKEVLTGITSSNNLRGKNISFLGDSISTPDYGGNNSNTIYPALIRDRYGANIFINAISSTPIAEKGGSQSFVTDSRWQSLNSTFTPDAIVIFGGTNDFGARQVPLGTISDTAKTTFYGGLKYLYSSIIQANLKAKVFHMTPLHRGESGFPEINTGTTFTLLQYVNAIKQVAEMYGVIVIDTFNNSGFNYYNMQVGEYTTDRLHPTVLGQSKLGDYVGNILNFHFKA